MLFNILHNIKKARMKKFYKNLLISAPISLFALMLVTDEESDLMLFGILILILAAVFLIIALKYFISAFNCEDSTFFLRLNKIGNKQQIASYFDDQLKQAIIEDEKIIVTPELLIVKNNYEQTLINEEIADITHLVHKTNFVIDYISIIALYSDGKKYEIKYRRPLGISNMEEKAKTTTATANILAANCNNLRKKSTLGDTV